MSTPLKYRVLVVDDDLDLNTTFSLLLEFDGHEVRTAYTGEAALLILEKNKFDLVIAEHCLPGMKGDELTALIKQKWPGQPIIITTADTNEFCEDYFPIAGVDCFLNKPFSMSQLREAIIWVLDRHRENQLISPKSLKVNYNHFEESRRRKPFKKSPDQ
jgi:DNA-binding response OmpR family regulator